MLTRHALKLGVLLLSLASGGVAAEPIVFGQTLPYSGPTSGWSAIGKVQAAYFKMINATGGVRGRQLQQLSLDDAYTPSKTVEQTRRLVESDKVLFMFGSLGDTNQAAVQTYLNSKKVPQIFIFAGGTRWNDPEHFPWTMQWPPTFKTEALLYAKYIQQSHPNARIAVLYQNSDFGKDYVKGLEVGLGAAAGRMIVARASYEPTSPTIDFTNGYPCLVEGDRFLQRDHPQIRSASDPKGGRTQLEANAGLGPSVSIYPDRAGACRSGPFGRHYLQHVHEGRSGSAVGKRCRPEEVPRFHEQIHAGCQRSRRF